MKKRLPIGFENFADIISGDYYYVDKTEMIENLIEHGGQVNLFTRPRRFGKSLNMSMLQHFFEIDKDKALFDGLKITMKKDLCEKYQAKFPVISISLKNVEGFTYEDAYNSLWEIISDEAQRVTETIEVQRLSPIEQKKLEEIVWQEGSLEHSLKTLSKILYRYHGRKVVILIDEYDVPLDKAYRNGYYEKMVFLIRQMLSSVLKTNTSLQMGVLTGCLRISRESIFTGLNNFVVNGISDGIYDECFGFTDEEVKELLKYYQLEKYYDVAKEWYDGFHFGNQEIYCPWDILNYIRDVQFDTGMQPRKYWINTSSNDLIRRFVDKADRRTREEIEALINQKSIRKKIREDLTYSEINQSIQNLWSVLYMTGYLTKDSIDADGMFELVIPNKEIQEIFVEQIGEWFVATIQKDKNKINEFFQGFVEGETEVIENYLNICLARSMSIRDTSGKSKTENFYHGLLLGLLDYQGQDWTIESNREGGAGYADIVAYRIEESCGFIIEIKYADSLSNLEKYAETALKQIEKKQYIQYFLNKRIRNIKKYGIAFYQKNCLVKGGESCERGK